MPDKKPAVRPPKPVPEGIDSPPQEVAHVLLNTPLKRCEDWRFIRKRRLRG